MSSELLFLSKVLKSGEFRVISPGNFKKELGKADSKYVPTIQQDAHDALQTILQNMEEELVNDDASKKIIEETFDGNITRSTTCSKCMNETTITDPMRFMSLEIPENSNTLEECFKSNMEEEILCDKRCERCCTYEAKTKTLITVTPNVMIIQLKRFKKEGRLPSKIKKRISVPPKLDIGEYAIQGENSSYELASIINHKGGLAAGHYTALVRDDQEDSWVLYDDELSERKDVQDVILNKEAYILFYRKMKKTEREECQNESQKVRR